MNTDLKSSEEFVNTPNTWENDRKEKDRKETDRKETREKGRAKEKIVDPSEKPEDEEGQVKPIRPEERNPKKINH